MKHAINVKYCK